MNTAPIHRQVVLAGGGYAHLLLIRSWCMQPLAGVRLTLVSPQSRLPYSGMLPGLLAGEYTHEETHIDLWRLCQRAGVRLLIDEVRGLDRRAKRVILATRPALDYDLVSINTGPLNDQRVPGVAEHAVPLKPIARFLPQWEECLRQLRTAGRALRVVMVGGGAGSVESLLGMARGLMRDGHIPHKPQFVLLTASARLLPDYPRKVSAAALARCREAGIEVLCNQRVSRVDAALLYTADSFSAVVPHDILLWCGEAAAAAWPAESGLDCDERGFIRINAQLQSVSDPTVFAAGDAAAFSEQALPKAGVYAVRQAPVLYHNLRAALLHQNLKRYRPQSRFLSLLNLDRHYAAGSYGPLAARGRLLQRWKARIDRRFIQSLQGLYSDQHVMSPAGESLVHPALVETPVDPALRCGGCGGKLAATGLAAVLKEVLGTQQPEDAALLQLPGTRLLQSVDLLRSPIDDPWRFGRLACAHALNDLYAMGATPHSLQVALTLPYAADAIQQSELRQVLEGILSVCREQRLELAGGHSAEGHDLLLALTVNGVPGLRELTKRGLRAGDLLVTNAMLGSGIALAAHMQHRCPAPLLDAALQNMGRSHAAAAARLLTLDTSACTDISGFGLLGHLVEMLQHSELVVELDPDALPLLPGIQSLVSQGLHSSLMPDNAAYVLRSGYFAELQQHPLWPILLDPQTAGGLLAGIAPHDAQAAAESGFRVVGKVLRRETQA